MTVPQTTDHEMIPESKAAQWAWRVSLITKTFYLVVASATQSRYAEGVLYCQPRVSTLG
jgi:hypothetical protein